jgi:hypothetical protein
VATLPRASARTDTLPTRVLRGAVRVCAGGDVTLGTNLDTAWTRVASTRLRTQFRQRDDPATLLAPLRALVSDAELVLVNVESAIGAGPAPSKCSARSTNCFAFRAPPSSARALRGLRTTGTVIGNLANNHARDAGREGRDSTIAALERAGVVVTGADSNATPVRTRAGDTIGVLGFYTSDSTPDARDTAAVRRLVARAFDRFPAVIVTMHLGAEGRDAQRTSDMGERYLGNRSRQSGGLRGCRRARRCGAGDRSRAARAARRRMARARRADRVLARKSRDVRALPVG